MIRKEVKEEMKSSEMEAIEKRKRVNMIKSKL